MFKSISLLAESPRVIRKYSNRFPAEEVMRWPLETFLDRTRLTPGGQITRTTLLRLDKPESAYLLSPHPAQITWKLEGPERAYEHFGPPFLLNTSTLYQKIRNIQPHIAGRSTAGYRGVEV